MCASQVIRGVRQTIGCNRMKTYQLHDETGRLLAFEIDNAWLQPRGMPGVIAHLQGAHLLRRSCDGSLDERFRFQVGEECFLVLEVGGDSKRYWVGPESGGFTTVTATVCAAFSKSSPDLWFRVLRFGAIATLVVGCGSLAALWFVALPESVALFGVWALVAGGLGVLGVIILAVAGVTGMSVKPDETRTQSTESMRGWRTRA
jgi:hypothetical protein